MDKTPHIAEEQLVMMMDKAHKKNSIFNPYLADNIFNYFNKYILLHEQEGNTGKYSAREMAVLARV